MTLARLCRHRVLRLSQEGHQAAPKPANYELDPAPASGQIRSVNAMSFASGIADQWLAHGARCWVGTVSGSIVFRAWISTDRDFISRLVPWCTGQRAPGYVFHVETLPQHRTRGYATVFLSTVSRRLFDHGVDTVFVRVLPDNVPSIAAFTKAGFADDGQLTELHVMRRRVFWRRTR